MALSTPCDRFVAWLRWYLRTHPSSMPSQNALVRPLGVSSGGIPQVPSRSGGRSPSCELLVAARELIGVPVDVTRLYDQPEAELLC